MNEQEIQQTAINVYGLANIGCSMENPTFQTLVINNDGSQEAVAEEMTEDEYEVVDLKFFDIKRFGTKERQKAFLRILEQVLPKMDVDSGRDWVALYIAYHYYINKLVLTKGYADFFTDIERLLPGRLTKVKQQEAKAISVTSSIPRHWLRNADAGLSSITVCPSWMSGVYRNTTIG